MSQFVLLPYEYPFSGANSKPHATARLTVGGKARNFVLKIHEGTLYFKEPARSQIFVVLDEFDADLARDSIGLVSRWQQQVAQNNYGAFVTKRDYFPKIPVRAQILMVLNADGSGWMKEHFDSQWFLMPDEKAAPLDIWNDKEVEAQIRERLFPVQRQLINRALTPEILTAESPRWLAEDGDRITELLVAATRLFVPPSDYWNDAERRILKIKSHSTFAKGDIEGYWLKHAQHNLKFKQFWDILETHIQFVGIRWSEGGENLEQYGRRRNEKVFQAGLEKWGHLWRGNWGPQRASFKIELPDTTNQTAHERMEAALTLREWLNGKIPAGEIESFFSQ
ncbi:hypothetical protein IAD21_01546 [Abditibacteriota bacterium]|nr:hypothetical protein IAD21_01546 [Abditibacteriota bacterium]